MDIEFNALYRSNFLKLGIHNLNFVSNYGLKLQRFQTLMTKHELTIVFKMPLWMKERKLLYWASIILEYTQRGYICPYFPASED